METTSTETVYHKLNNIIIDALKQNNVPWFKPFNRYTLPLNAITNRPYRSLNAFLLNLLSYNDPRYISFTQSKDLKGYFEQNKVNIPVYFWNFKYFEKSTGEELNDQDLKTLPDTAVKKTASLIQYNLVNYSHFVSNEDNPVDLRDLELHKHVAKSIDSNSNYLPLNPEGSFNITLAQRIVNQMENLPSLTTVTHYPAHMPSLDLFEKQSQYYSYLFKLLVASTSHQHRLNRTYPKHEKYQAHRIEQLISNMGAAILCGHVGISPHIPEDSDKLINDWIQMAQENPRFFLDAATQAQKAVDHILN